VEVLVEAEVLDPVLSRWVVARYADGSGARLDSCCRLAELDMSNHKSYSALAEDLRAW
jgi:hypothetical protein